MKSCIATAFILGILLAGSALGAAYAIDLHSARATAMATAVRASIDDASAVFFNPAGMLHAGKVLDVQLGDTLVIPFIKYTDLNGASTTTTTQVIPPPNFYATYGINDLVSVGIGVFSPFGLVVPWPLISNDRPWAGRFLAQHVELKTFFVNPSVAVRLHDRVRLGAGISLIRGTASLTRSINFVNSEGKVDLGAGAWTWGANAGLQVDAIPSILSFGATFRMPAKFNLTGSAHFTNVPLEFQSSAHDQQAKTTIHLPLVGALAVGVRPIPELRIGFDAEYNGWQKVQELKITFEDPATPEVFLPKDWKYTWNYHLGAEYEINPQWRARAGILYDPAPTPNDTITPDLPDFNRVNLAAGGGYRWSHFSVDAAYQLVILTKNTSTSPLFPGTYNGISHIVGLSFGWRGDIAGMLASR
jgi:long-chain fatty acid transport protein